MLVAAQRGGEHEIFQPPGRLRNVLRREMLPAQVLTAMHEARLFRMYIPKALVGLEIDSITSMIVVEEIA